MLMNCTLTTTLYDVLIMHKISVVLRFYNDCDEYHELMRFSIPTSSAKSHNCALELCITRCCAKIGLVARAH
jgi:hypothetical protein